MFPLPIISNTSIAPEHSNEYERYVAELLETDNASLPFSTLTGGALNCWFKYTPDTVVPTTIGTSGSPFGYGVWYKLNVETTPSVFQHMFPTKELFLDQLANSRYFSFTRTHSAYRGYHPQLLIEMKFTQTQKLIRVQAKQFLPFPISSIMIAVLVG